MARSISDEPLTDIHTVIGGRSFRVTAIFAPTMNAWGGWYQADDEDAMSATGTYESATTALTGTVKHLLDNIRYVAMIFDAARANHAPADAPDDRCPDCKGSGIGLRLHGGETWPCRRCEGTGRKESL